MPRKRFGQHFLNDPTVLARIIQSIAPAQDDAIVEIGPGRGALTEPLLDLVRHLHVIEIDRDLAHQLQQWESAPERLHVHCADALAFDFTGIAPGRRLRIIGNLPYNISTPLLLFLATFCEHLSDAHFMLQREVVERLAAGPGDKAYSRLSVTVACCFDVQPLFEVPPSAFSPPPAVVSGFVRLLPQPAPPPPEVRRRLDQVLRQAFSNRRKTSANALSGVLDREALEHLGIAPECRPDTITLQQFLDMVEFLENTA